MAQKILLEQIREIKEKRELFSYIPCNVYQLGSVEYKVIYSSPSIRYLMQILYYIPDDITVDILNSCYFIFPIRDHGMYIPSTHLKDRDIIVFDSFDGIEEKTIFRIMLHEIAHSYLKHLGSKTDSERAQREKEASEWSDQMLKIVY